VIAKKYSGEYAPEVIKMAVEMKYKFSDIECLNTDDLNKVCIIACKIFMQEGDTAQRFLFGEVKNYIKGK